MKKLIKGNLLFNNFRVLISNVPMTYLIERVPRDVRGDVVRAEVPDESHDARGVADRDVLRLLEHRVIKGQGLGGTGKSLIVAESRDAHQHVTVIARDEGRVYAEMFGYRSLRPTRGEGVPRPLELLESEVAEIRL